MKFNDFVPSRGSEVDSYIGWLLVSLAYFKSAHLETKSYARHKAYDFYYVEVQGPLDQFSEQYLGFSGKEYKASLPSASDLPKDPVDFLDELLKASDKSMIHFLRPSSRLWTISLVSFTRLSIC
ncbi:hypothetical protein EpBp7_0033 [Escherichia phage Bp7]|uniref:Uncharacterized protein mobD.6 n=1 Tax=Escherichia phage Bp7 TaxID=1052121 RepID=G3MUR5_9CAUD|nr:starvation-inducible transcriptional regulator [Escherichia phage Bp7]AEN93750.1 hypothetical protein EpBp7_0033 [Escherichia phage Bp7]